MWHTAVRCLADHREAAAARELEDQVGLGRVLHGSVPRGEAGSGCEGRPTYIGTYAAYVSG
jgi:hypothetical protein